MIPYFHIKVDDILSTTETSTIDFFLRIIRHRLDSHIYGFDI